MSKWVQVPNYFLKKKKKLFNSFDFFKKIKRVIKPKIVFNGIIIKDKYINLKKFNKSFFIEVNNFKIDNLILEYLHLNISIDHIIMDINKKKFIDINEFIIKIYINSKNLFINIYIRTYDVRIENFKQLNKKILINFKSYNFKNFSSNKINGIFFKLKNNKYIELWDDTNSKNLLFWSNFKLKDNK
jgi:hypothetical protein